MLNFSHQGYFTDKQSLKLYKYTNNITVVNFISQNIHYNTEAITWKEIKIADIGANHRSSLDRVIWLRAKVGAKRLYTYSTINRIIEHGKKCTSLKCEGARTLVWFPSSVPLLYNDSGWRQVPDYPYAYPAILLLLEIWRFWIYTFFFLSLSTATQCKLRIQ